MKYDYEYKKEIVDVAKLMSEQGIVGTYEGNISVRANGKIFLTPSGRSKAHLTEGQILTTDYEGNLIEGDLKPTSELPMHLKCFNLREDIGAVIHCHAPYATAFAQQNIEIKNDISPEFIMLFGKVPLLRYGTPGTNDLVNDLDNYIEDYDVFLLANHGVLAVGKNTMEVYSKLISLELLLKTETIRSLIKDDKNVSLSSKEYKLLLEKGKSNRGLQK